MIDGVAIKELTPHPDERGYLMEMVRSTDDIFEKFGQAYVSLNHPGVIRGWHWHRLQTDFFVVVKGLVRVALYDGRDGSPTQGQVEEYLLGDGNSILLKIPPGVLHGYKTIGTEPSLLINFPTEVYNASQPDELRRAWNDPTLPYNWDRPGEPLRPEISH